MNKKKVLVFPAGTEIASEIFNSLKYIKSIELYGASSVSCHSEFIFKKHFENIPLASDIKCVDALNKIIDMYKIDLVYPAHDDALYLLTENQSILHAKLITSNLETVRLCRSKKKTYDFFIKESFIPKIYHSSNLVDNYPVFVRPTVSQGSVGAKKIENKDELSLLMNESNREYIISEYLPGKEYTVDCFTDKKGILRACYLRSRERIKSGIAVRSSLLEMNEDVMKIADKINSKLVFSGAWFFQLKKDINNDYKLLEISPRIPGTMAVSRTLGINYPLLTIYNLLDEEFELITNDYSVMLDRAFINRYKLNISYDKIYIDFDDTIYINDKVNTQLMMFLYQCVNDKKEIILLTKHDGDCDEYFKKYHISKNLFTKIIHLERNDEKFKYIDKNSIFIDDSFAERKKVKEKCNIYVFDLDMIESLIDWRL